jgi:hypothetical protein
MIGREELLQKQGTTLALLVAAAAAGKGLKQWGEVGLPRTLVGRWQGQGGQGQCRMRRLMRGLHKLVAAVETEAVAAAVAVAEQEGAAFPVAAAERQHLL